MDDFRAVIPDFFYPAIPGLPTTPFPIANPFIPDCQPLHSRLPTRSFPIANPFIPDCQPLHSRLPTPSFPIANPFIPDFYPAIPGRQPRSFPLSPPPVIPAKAGIQAAKAVGTPAERELSAAP